MTNSTHTNHLAAESSPYLLQHAHNPVDWYPWSEAALEKARAEDKPILLSIGYAACHWCHVMAHESFEDPETATVMNELFVNIKVDREERPDLDKIYQTAHYLLTQRSGGWPLTIFLTPHDLIPFFSGTYFPIEPRFQLPAFKEVLQGIATIYKYRMPEIKQQSDELLKLLHHTGPAPLTGVVNAQPLLLAMESFQYNYDQINGGFGEAPKFPQPAKLAFLLANDSEMAFNTLEHLAAGGIHDQLEGGFYRYSVDAAWEIPHFEKMLYDNAQLLFLYATASKQRNDEHFANIARATGNWVLTRMQAPEGGYFSSIDADSEGHEGKFYIWDKKEVQKLLTPEEYALIELYFGLDNPANFEHQWHFYISEPLTSIAEQLNISQAVAQNLLDSAKTKLLTVRNKRIAPNRDEKILTAWNALMIQGLLTAGVYLEESAFIESAQRALTFIKQKLYVNKRLLACIKDNKASLPGYLDDYAFLIQALITSLQVNWNTEQLIFAQELADTLLDYFFDKNNGGFFFTANDHEKLLYRPKTMMDEAIPSGNGIATRALLTLGYLIGEPRYIEAAEKTLQTAWAALHQYPAEHAALLLSLKEFLNPPAIIIIRGEPHEIKKWREIAKTIHHYVFTIPNDAHDLPPALATKQTKKPACAYICQGMQCSRVIEDINQLSL